VSGRRKEKGKRTYDDGLEEGLLLSDGTRTGKFGQPDRLLERRIGFREVVLREKRD
jgi:2-methylcitrate dehydratase PrpD